MKKRYNKPEMNPFENYKQAIDASVEAAQVKLNIDKQRRLTPKGDYLVFRLETTLTNKLQDCFEIEEMLPLTLEVPPAHVSGDYALALFPLAKVTGKAPHELAQTAQNYLTTRLPAEIESVTATGPYLNITLASEAYNQILQHITSLADHYGETDTHTERVMVIDFSHPNIAKPIGVGHLRSTIIGQALSNIYEATGYSVIKDNHLGDWGTQFGQLLYAFQTWGDREALATNPIRVLKDLYVRFNEEAKEKPELLDEARKLFVALEQKDPALVALWQEFRDLSLREYETTYKLLGTTFDTYVGESYFEDQTDSTVEDALAKGAAVNDVETGAVLVKDLDSLPTFLLRKQDGSSLYITRDLATILFRVKHFDPDLLMYVVGAEQELNFRQLFALAKKLNYLGKAEARHVPFGMVLRDGKKMSTRRGTLIELDELMTQAIATSRKMLASRTPDLSEAELQSLSEIIGISAIIYHDLRQSRIKNISFDWERMLDLEGGSAVYLQYTYVRTQSLLRQAKELARTSNPQLHHPLERDLARKLAHYPAVILQAQAGDAPHLIAGYLEELAQLFNAFYNEVPVLKAQTDEQASRLVLVESVATVLNNGLSLLSIRLPHKM